MSSTWMGPSYLIQAARDGDYDTQKSLESSVLRKRQDDMGLTTGSAASRSLMLLEKTGLDCAAPGGEGAAAGEWGGCD